jgi:mRNA interferase RelE/StbE
MNMFSVEYSKAARKSLKAVPRNTARLIMEKIKSLAEDPMASSNNVRKLTNHPGFRLRIGDWRVVYTIHEQALIIAVIRIAPRGDVYK